MMEQGIAPLWTLVTKTLVWVSWEWKNKTKINNNNKKTKKLVKPVSIVQSSCFILYISIIRLKNLYENSLWHWLSLKKSLGFDCCRIEEPVCVVQDHSLLLNNYAWLLVIQIHSRLFPRGRLAWWTGYKLPSSLFTLKKRIILSLL